MLYQFKLPIGSWTLSGHKKCVWFICSSDKPIENIREAFFLIEEKVGLRIDKVCSEYMEQFLTEEQYHLLREFIPGADEEFLEDSLDDEWDPVEAKEEAEEARESYWTGEFQQALEHKEFATLVVNLLNHVDPSLKIKIEEEIPTLHFYGGSVKEYIGDLGYGLF